MGEIPKKKQAGREFSSDDVAEIKSLKIDDLIVDDRNANRGTDLGKELLKTSVERYGAGRGVLVDRNMKLIAGNHSVKELRRQGIENIIVVPTDGSTLVVTQRTDIDKDSKEGHELAIADNRVGQANLYFDENLIDELTSEFDLELEDFAMTFNESTIGDYEGSQDDDGLSRETNAKHSKAGELDERQSGGTYALIVALTDRERDELDEFKKKYCIETDQDAFREMFKMVKDL